VVYAHEVTGVVRSRNIPISRVGVVFVQKFSFLPVCALLLVMRIHSISSCSGTADGLAQFTSNTRKFLGPRGLKKDWNSYAYKHIKFSADMLRTILRKIVVVMP
jgi:hypothetical protein